MTLPLQKHLTMNRSPVITTSGATPTENKNISTSSNSPLVYWRPSWQTDQSHKRIDFCFVFFIPALPNQLNKKKNQNLAKPEKKEKTLKTTDR